MAQFEGKERRQAKIDVCLKEYGMATLEEAKENWKNLIWTKKAE